MVQRTTAEWTTYLHEHIPVTKAMQAEVIQADWDRTEIKFPLGPNLNHRETAFGGSISTAGILVCWLQLNLRMRQLERKPRIVVQTSKTDFLKPMESDFTAICEPTDEAAWKKYLSMFERKSRGRLLLRSQLLCGSDIAAVHAGEFVSID